jgi:hypothetical protein
MAALDPSAPPVATGPTPFPGTTEPWSRPDGETLLEAVNHKLAAYGWSCPGRSRAPGPAAVAGVKFVRLASGASNAPVASLGRRQWGPISRRYALSFGTGRIKPAADV